MGINVPAYLVVIRSKLVEALLDDVVPVEVLDQRHDVQAEGNDNRMDLGVVSEISLLFFIIIIPPVSEESRFEKGNTRLPLRG